jgi:hypothetical protein
VVVGRAGARERKAVERLLVRGPLPA